MAAQDAPCPGAVFTSPRWFILFLVFGLYLTLRGYHSRDNDQAYRLPLLLHYQNPALFADDPFVRSFDAFNPHRGYLVLLDLASRPWGLSAGLFVLFVLTFTGTCVGFDRLARAVWPQKGPVVGLVAIGIALMAKAGNIGTIHIFEAILLDRLIGLALGWLALAWVVEQPGRRAAPAAMEIGLAAMVHPSAGLQLAMLLGTSWWAWTLLPGATGVDRRQAFFGTVALGVALLPWGFLYLGQAPRLHAGLSAEEFRLLSAELQSPQHMLPHLWRLSQWLAFACYPILAVLALARRERAESQALEAATWPAPRTRLAIVLAVNAAGLVMAWLAVEVFNNVSATLFQPVRMATVFRGLALIAVSGRMVGLYTDGRFVDRARALLVAIGLAGDWMLVVATAVDLAVTGAETVPAWLRLKKRGGHLTWAPRPSHHCSFPPLGVGIEGGSRPSRQGPQCTPSDSPFARGRVVLDALSLSVFGITLGIGLAFLARHDTEASPWFLIGPLGALIILSRLVRGRTPGWNRRRLGWALALSWAIPLAALLAGQFADPRAAWSAGLIERCRFGAVPTDDMERLALWCREHTPARARFIGPPGPKAFRLWSRRSLAFNRAGSPYHAEGLADWAARFLDHVGFQGSYRELVRAYQRDRHGLERGYQAMSDAQRAALARRQGAAYVIAAPPADHRDEHAPGGGLLELLHVEGRYAVYRVRDPRPTVTTAPPPPPPRPQVRTAAAASAGTG